MRVPCCHWDYGVPSFPWRVVQNLYFGNTLDEIDPTLTKHFITVDDLSWQVLYQYPDSLASAEIKNARSTPRQVFKRYVQTPRAKRLDVSWFVRELVQPVSVLT